MPPPVVPAVENRGDGKSLEVLFGQLSQHHSQPLLAFRLSVRSFCLQLNDPLKSDLAYRNSQMTPLEGVLASKTDEKVSTHTSNGGGKDIGEGPV